MLEQTELVDSLSLIASMVTLVFITELTAISIEISSKITGGFIVDFGASFGMIGVE